MMLTMHTLIDIRDIKKLTCEEIYETFFCARKLVRYRIFIVIVLTKSFGAKIFSKIFFRYKGVNLFYSSGGKILMNIFVSVISLALVFLT
eukprot:TRINITY_DN1145_c0_g1_i4.p1 TRINITY_DN1145_c0_g1~~TRINITY_DN1145_c0_g1_i4.p1  ORF type:complete len:90 (+),score=4.38 TRINITY_DN1145_c0_g1_i4:338-607(+)